MLHNIRACYITVYLKDGSVSRYIIINFHLGFPTYRYIYIYISLQYIIMNIMTFSCLSQHCQLNAKKYNFQESMGNCISYILIFWSQLKVDILMDRLVDKKSSISFSLLIRFQVYSKMNINIDFAIFSMESITQHMPIKLKTIPRYLQCLNLLLRIMR